MDFSSVVLLFGALLLTVVLLLVIWGVMVRRRTANIERRVARPESPAAAPHAKFEADERFASLTGEQIEDQVRQRLKSYPDLTDVKIDFATGPDESLVIWINDRSHTDIEQIPDDRIRAAISEAVESFDR